MVSSKRATVWCENFTFVLACGCISMPKTKWQRRTARARTAKASATLLAPYTTSQDDGKLIIGMSIHINTITTQL